METLSVLSAPNRVISPVASPSPCFKRHFVQSPSGALGESSAPHSSQNRFSLIIADKRWFQSLQKQNGPRVTRRILALNRETRERTPTIHNSKSSFACFAVELRVSVTWRRRFGIESASPRSGPWLNSTRPLTTGVPLQRRPGWRPCALFRSAAVRDSAGASFVPSFSRRLLSCRGGQPSRRG